MLGSMGRSSDESSDQLGHAVPHAQRLHANVAMRERCFHSKFNSFGCITTERVSSVPQAASPASERSESAATKMHAALSASAAPHAGSTVQPNAAVLTERSCGKTAATVRASSNWVSACL